MNRASEPPRLQNGHFNQRHSGVGEEHYRLLAETFSLPVLTIDGIKEPFMARLAPVDRPMNRQLGCAAYGDLVDCRRIACQHGLVDRRLVRLSAAGDLAETATAGGRGAGD